MGKVKYTSNFGMEIREERACITRISTSTQKKKPNIYWFFLTEDRCIGSYSQHVGFINYYHRWVFCTFQMLKCDQVSWWNYGTCRMNHFQILPQIYSYQLEMQQEYETCQIFSIISLFVCFPQLNFHVLPSKLLYPNVIKVWSLLLKRHNIVFLRIFW